MPSNIFYRRMAFPHPIAKHGEGVYLWDTSGKRYLDASGGALVVNIGHGVTEVAEAMSRQAASLAYVHGTMFTTPALEAYSQRLAEVVPIDQPRFYYMASGSEAVETAIKFARTLQVARGESSREMIISRWGSYHGLTLGALAVTGRPKFRKLFTPLFRDQPHIPPPYCYRCPFGASRTSCNFECAQALTIEILKQGPERVFAFIAESISGGTLGAVVPPDEYWPLIAQTCARYGVLLIVDEVMCGFGRTGRWFAIEHFGVRPDLITLGKGMTGGYFPISAAAVRKEDVETVRINQGDFTHGGTYSHHTVGAATALAVFEYMEKHDLINNSARQGAHLGRRLREELGGLPCVGDVRGLGMMWGVEFVANPVTREPFPPERHFTQQVCDLAFERGVIFYPGTGSVDGVAGDHLLVAPPYIITEEQVDEVISVLKEAILSMWSKER